jgi:hypothetical protein
MTKTIAGDLQMTSDQIRDISVQVYKIRLEDGSKGAVERMLAKDADDGRKLRRRAESYDALTRAYLKVLYGKEPPLG